MKLKGYLATALFVGVAIMGTGCASDNSAAGKENAETALGIESTYIGTYTKAMGAMGSISGGHRIDFYNDGTMKIDSGFFGGMMGGSIEGYEGTYDLEKMKENQLEGSYTHGEETEDLIAAIEDDKFRTQVYLITSMPDDATNPEVSGITYYKSGVMDSEAENAEIYIGTTVNEGKTYVYELAIQEDGTFKAVASVDGKANEIEGKYEIVEAGLEGTDTIEFTYEGKTESFDYSSPDMIPGGFAEENGQTIISNLIKIK